MNKFDRVISLLVVLQSKKIVRAQDLAERFQVSLRTIYRDIRSLETAGIPIISEAEWDTPLCLDIIYHR